MIKKWFYCAPKIRINNFFRTFCDDLIFDLNNEFMLIKWVSIVVFSTTDIVSNSFKLLFDNRNLYIARKWTHFFSAKDIQSDSQTYVEVTRYKGCSSLKQVYEIFCSNFDYSLHPFPESRPTVFQVHAAAKCLKLKYDDLSQFIF